MTTEYEQQMQELFNAYEQEKMKREQVEQQMGQQASRFGSTKQDEDLIRWQLELDNILERVEHLLRGDLLNFDQGGNLIWTKPEDQDDVLFNENGVQEILRMLSLYLNRNTILSNYDEETINYKVYDFGMELIDLIFMKYEQMGLDDKQKIKYYPMICREIIDVVHSAYLRALNGGERQSLREARHVSQQINPIQPNIPGMNQPKTFSLMKPSTWRKH